ncbi:glycosyltransferase family 4 protein [Rhizobium sp. G21]|uniref:glycosyltransferase family 4 protein n=1 Tax=Rhizobium sp. G21 TaxID=2758439 RepID=UPI001602E73A|nr:glycosyltransferase family 4 protein [Rhizobium sp. G21]MBB1248042.1 glycosyltransferase family 4 protein [Rhizobium sp. G21]
MSSQQSLRILQVLEPSGGGSGRHFNDLCGALSRRGHEVTAIYSPMRAEERFVDELTSLGLAGVHAVPMTRSPSPSDVGAWIKIRNIVAAHGPFDIIHGHSSKAGALTRLRAPGAHAPRVYTPHAFRTMDPTLGARGRQIFGGIESLFGRYFTDALICVSEDELVHAYHDLGIPRDILRLVVNGADAPPSGRRAEIRARCGLRDDALVIGFVGRLCEQKAPERLIRALGRLAKSTPDAHLLMIGSGPLEDMVRTEIARSGAADRIRLVSDIAGPEAMQAFDLMAMPSRYEAMSYVMLEAEAAGLPMVLTRVGGSSTVVDDGDNGLLVANEDDPSALAATLEAALAPDRLDRLRRAAADRRGRHSLAHMATETEAVYRSLVRR